MINQNLNSYMRSLGYQNPPSYISVGRIARFPAPNKGKNNRSAWAIQVNDQSVIFGDWITDAKYVWHDRQENMTTAEKVKAHTSAIEMVENLRRKFEANHKIAAEHCKIIFSNAKQVRKNHRYLQRKEVSNYGLRCLPEFAGLDDVVVVPICSFNKLGNLSIQSLQIIAADGTKRFFKGGKKQGGFYCLREPHEKGDILIAEGYATAATLADRLPDDAVYCAFDSGNIKSVALSIRQRYPTKTIIIAGDNDHRGKINTGKIKATEAAQAVCGHVLIPEFEQGDQGTDWNDYYLGKKRGEGREEENAKVKSIKEKLC